VYSLLKMPGGDARVAAQLASGPYGLGLRRTLAQYEGFVGTDLRRRRAAAPALGDVAEQQQQQRVQRLLGQRQGQAVDSDRTGAALLAQGDSRQAAPESQLTPGGARCGTVRYVRPGPPPAGRVNTDLAMGTGGRSGGSSESSSSSSSGGDGGRDDDDGPGAGTELGAAEPAGRAAHARAWKAGGERPAGEGDGRPPGCGSDGAWAPLADMAGVGGVTPACHSLGVLARGGRAGCEAARRRASCGAYTLSGNGACALHDSTMPGFGVEPRRGAVLVHACEGASPATPRGGAAPARGGSAFASGGRLGSCGASRYNMHIHLACDETRLLLELN
jgi:hypothetical protein